MTNDRRPQVAAIGGGTGLSTFLQGLKSFPVDISAIVTVADDGGSSGILREEFKMPPPGDIRNVLVSLSDTPNSLQKLLQFRFREEEGSNHYLSGHPIGNLMLAAMTQISDGDFNLAVERIADILNVNGEVYPVSHEAGAISARCANGEVVKGESNFAESGCEIVEIFYEEEVQASPGVLDVIRSADVIVLGPGSLYTSVIPNIVIPGVAQAIRENQKADIVYICNIMTEHGETDHYSVSDHVNALVRHGITNISKVIVNDMPIPEMILDGYRAEKAEEVSFDEAGLPSSVEPVFSRIIDIKNGTLRHNPIKTAAAVYGIVLEHI